MDAAQRGSRWWLGVIAVVVSCVPSRVPIRYGSLKMDERSFTYGHGVESFTLPNGLVVALVPDPHANLVGVDVRYLVGAADDPAGKSGLAHMVEHMTFEHRAEAGGPTLGDLLATASLSYNADTSWDATHYHEIALADQLDGLLAMELTRMAEGCAGLDPTAFEHERGIVLQELAQRGTGEVLDVMLGDMFGADHRYARGVGGTEVASLTLADVCSFVDAHYAPGRAILVVTGRIDPGRVRRAVVAQFGAITRRATGARAAIRPRALSREAARHAVEVDEPAAVVMFPAATWGSAEAFDDELVDALLVHRLEQLDRDQRWITHVEAGLLGSRRDGVRYFAIAVDDPARLGEAADAIYRIAGELPGPDPGLVLGTFAALRRSQLFEQLESIAQRGARCADYLQFTDHKRFQLRELETLQEINLDRLHARAEQMTRSTSQVVHFVPSKPHARAARPQLRSAAATFDAPVWRPAVDPAEADRPLVLPADLHPPAISELRLGNGMRVVMASDFTQPVFEARVVFPVGAFNTGPDRARLAEAAADLLDHNSVRGYSLKDFATLDWVMRLGAQLSAEVEEATTFTVRGSSTFADWHLWRLHWLLENGIYPYKVVQRVNEAAAHPAPRHDTGRSWARALREALFGGDHPYVRARSAAKPPVLSGDDLDAFRDAYYRASGATVILVGQFDPAALTRTVTELFGAWSAEPAPALQPIPAMHPAPGPSWIAHADPDATQVRITFAFAVMSARIASRGARRVVGEMVRNRLEQVRTQLGASYGIQVTYHWSDAGDFLTIDGHVDAARAGEVLRRMQADLDGLRAGDDRFVADFVRARRAALAHTLGDPMKSSTVTDEIEAAVTHHLPVDAAAAVPAAIASTTPSAAREVIAADLRPQRMVVVLSGRPADTAAAFAAAGVAQFRTVDDGPADAR